MTLTSRIGPVVFGPEVRKMQLVKTGYLVYTLKKINQCGFAYRHVGHRQVQHGSP